MEKHRLNILVLVAILNPLSHFSLSYSFRNCVENPTSNHTRFDCMYRYEQNASAIVADLPPSAKVLNISVCAVSTIPSGSFSHLPNLTVLRLHNKNLSNIDKDAFRNLFQLQIMNLSSNRISYLHPSTFNNLHSITNLLIQDNLLPSLSQAVFADLENLESLILRRNLLSSFSVVVESVAHMSKLTTLDLSFNRLPSLHHKARLPPSLQRLYLGNNRLKTLGCKTDLFSRVKVLDLSYHKNLSSKDFRGLDLGSITYLRLRSTSVNVGELLNVTNLTPQHMDFSGLGLNNSLVKLCKLLRKHVKTHAIRKMILQSNGIHNLSKATFHNCPSFTNILDLSQNELKTTGCLQFLRDHQQLQIIKVEHNHLTKLESCKRTDDLSFPHMKEMSYRYNRILLVSGFAFYHTPNLTNLELNINIIAYLDHKALHGLRNLKNLRLDNNLLTDVYEDSFEDLHSLNTLNLRNNRIAVIFNRTFHSLQKLEILDLGGNKISQLMPEAFSGLSSLTKLYLDRNCLKKIDGDLFGKLHNTLQVLDLEANNIRYSSMFENPPFVKLTKLLDLKLSGQLPRGIAMLPLDFFRGLSSLRSLWLTNNHIAFFGWNTFDDLLSLEFLVLDNSCVGVTQLKPGIFKNLRKLKHLRAKNLGIRSFSREVFGNLTRLEVVYLNHNVMQTLNSTFLEELLNLKYLDVEKCPLSCGCLNTDLQNWTNSTQKVQLAHIYDLKCPDLPNSDFHDFDTKVCYLHIEIYFFASTYSVSLLLTLIPLLYVKLYWKFKYSYYVFRSWFGEQWRRVREQEEDCEYDAFVSYNSEDEKWVLDTLVPNLEGNGSSFRLCLHHRDFELGRDIVDNIVKAVYSSRKTLCVVSQHYLHSEWCSLEIQLASYRMFDELRDVLLLIFLEPIPERQLSAYHRMRRVMLKKTYLQWPGRDCSDPTKAQELFWKKLKRALRSSNNRSREEEEGSKEREEEPQERAEEREHFINERQKDDEPYYLMP
ncbi:toll-like receptor 21 [Chanos chanos]|uniref:Toll-like receptor 21 n=1 Tax=Chanos chanos TaxID=29144 RepID=A0A6J2W6F6_CHACN|nr:toll-like receptor 13 [Chanos chanos]